MQVRYGRTCPEGFLPVYSVDTEEEARRLIAATCKMGWDGKYYAPELAEEQTLETLLAFGDRLHEVQMALKGGGIHR